MTDAVPREVPRKLASSGASAKSVRQTAGLPDAADDAVAGRNGVQAQIAFERGRTGGGLLQNRGRHIDERRTTGRDKRRGQFPAGPLHHVKSAALGIEDPRRALDNEPMQI